MSTKKKQLDSNQVVEIKLTELHPFKNHPFTSLLMSRELLSAMV